MGRSAGARGSKAALSIMQLPDLKARARNVRAANLFVRETLRVLLLCSYFAHDIMATAVNNSEWAV